MLGFIGRPLDRLERLGHRSRKSLDAALVFAITDVNTAGFDAAPDSHFGGCLAR
jgi:hypothetical protein